MPIDPEKLKAVFEEFSALAVTSIEREAGLPNRKLKEFMKRKQNLSQEQERSLKNVLAKYGVFQGESSELGNFLNEKKLDV